MTQLDIDVAMATIHRQDDAYLARKGTTAQAIYDSIQSNVPRWLAVLTPDEISAQLFRLTGVDVLAEVAVRSINRCHKPCKL